MNPLPVDSPLPSTTPISVGLTCWRWERPAPVIMELAQRFGVHLELRERIRFLRLEVDCLVSGANTERFIGEFVRRC